MPKNIKKNIKYEKNLSYLQKDFKSFRDEIISYARQHYSDKIIDFSESSLAGLFVDMAAYVGDSLSFYLDHQFNELFLDTAIENKNIEKLIRLTGVEIRGPSPSNAEVTITVTIPATLSKNEYVPVENYLPVIKQETVFTSNDGIEYILVEDVDFSRKDVNGNLIANIVSADVLTNGIIESFKMSMKGICTSAKTEQETFEIDNTYTPFRTITLNKANVSEIISVVDSDGNEYYQVESLTQDTVFKRFDNNNSDGFEVSQRLSMIPAPRRFVMSRSRQTKLTTLRFGSGKEEQFDDDIIPDPSLHAISLYGDRKTFTKISIDPNSFLTTSTLGISPRGTSLKITYRYGGALEDNVSAGEIKNVKILITEFAKSIDNQIGADIRDSAIVTNEFPAYGGENEPTIEDLKISAIFGKTSQSRIVSREDLIARVYSMPSNFGRVFRVGLFENSNNPLAAQLSILSRNPSGQLILSHDTLKENLVTYLSAYRIISDNIDIVDGKILNIGINYEVTVIKGFIYESVIQKINSSLKKYFNIENFQIGQPIIVGEINNIILNAEGVQSLISLNFVNFSKTLNNRNYSNEKFSIVENLNRGMIFPPVNGIFEIKYPEYDIVGRAV